MKCQLNLTSMFNLANMRFKNVFSLIFRYNVSIKPLINYSRYQKLKFSVYSTCTINQKKFLFSSAPLNARIFQEDGDSDDEFDIEYDHNRVKIEEGYARDLLYKNSKDLLLNRIYCCASVQELFNVLNSNLGYYQCEHITQTIFVLHDLLRIYQDFNAGNMKSVKKASNEFLEKLQQSESFYKLRELIKEKVYLFDLDTLSYSLLYLNKLGLSINDSLMQLLCDTLKRNLLKKFSLLYCSRYLQAVFSNYNLQSYFMSQEFIPLVIDEIERCTSIENLRDISVSLNKLHNVVTDETLDNYKTKVESLIANDTLKSSDYDAVLQIIAFLNYPKWREKNSVLISKCMLLIKNNLNELNISDITFLYEVFIKMQEPGEILNDLQRCSSRHFHQLDETPTAQKIALFSTLIHFAPPNLRTKFHKTLKKYVQECDNYDNLIFLRKLLSYVKISDVNLCNLYWSKILKCLKNNDDIDVLKLSQNYINFSSDVDNYRHHQFENEILTMFEKQSKEVNYEFFPQKLATMLCFVLIYGRNTILLEHLVKKIETNWEQLKYIDCLRLSYSLKMFNELDKNYLKNEYARRIDKTVDKIISKEVRNMKSDLWKNNALLKSCLYKNKIDKNLDKLLNNFRNFKHISSKNIENIYYCFLMTNSLIPNVVDNMIEYVLAYKSHVLGFNAARIVYLCYCLGYHPKNMAEFCRTSTDIIIRDQERMTGLLLLYSSLALCFFNKLPNSLIKSIFNVEFMDKLDTELENCYARDKYPQRVRNYLMQLNRAVCLDYPESGVPWFHQKYIEEMSKVKKMKRSLFAIKISEYLRRIVHVDALEENVVTPYGYEVDFVVKMNENDEVIGSESHYTKKLALILIPEFAYTRIIAQLKGSFQLKKRHLEILGYRVVFIKFSDWISLYYAEERIDFLCSLIWPEKFNNLINKETLR